MSDRAGYDWSALQRHTMTKDVQLKPCPFCGSIKIKDCHDDGIAWQKCSGCGATGPIIRRYDGEEGEEVIDWNARALASENAALREAVSHHSTKTAQWAYTLQARDEEISALRAAIEEYISGIHPEDRCEEDRSLEQALQVKSHD